MPDEAGTETTTQTTSTETQAPPTGIPQDEVNRIAAREKDQGRRAAEAAIAEKLGVTVEEAAQIVKAAREAADADKSEADKAKGAAATEKAKREQAERELAQERHDRKVELELIDAGVPAKAAAKLVKLVDSEPGSDDAAVKAAVETLKTEMPQVFEAKSAEEEEGGETKPPKPSSDPKGTPPKPTAGEDAMSRGAERAKGFGARASYDLPGLTK